MKNVVPLKKLEDFGIESEYAVITPDMARKFLETNSRNRNIYQPIIERYAEKMRAGKWQFTADAIRFDRNGILIDGQHRLLACIAANTPFSALIIRNLDPDIMEVIDSGKKRTSGDALHMIGIPSSNNVASVCRWLLTVKKGGPTKQCNRNFDTTDIIEVSRRHLSIIDSVNHCYGLAGAGRHGLMVMLHYVGKNLLTEKDKKGNIIRTFGDEADAFIRVFKEGVPAYDGDPALLLREYFLRTRKLAATVDSKSAYCNAVNAFNYCMKGKSLKGPWRLRSGDVAIDNLDLDLI